MPISRPIALVTATALTALLSAAPLAAQDPPGTTSTTGGSTTTSTPGGSTTTSTPGGSTTTSTPGGSTTTSTPGGSTTTSTPGGSTTTSTPGGSTTTSTTTPDGTDADIPTRVVIPEGETPGDGALTLTVPEDASVNMGAPSTQGDRLRFDADMPAVTITDTRNDTQAGDGGWEVTGEADDFTTEDDDPGTPGTPGTPGEGDSFGAEHLGWIPWADADGRMGVEAGPRVDGVLRGGPGLADPATLVSATGAGRTGSATAGAHLILEVPADTEPGNYHSSIHLSLFPVD